MTPAVRLSFSLVLSLLLWLPTVPAALGADNDPATIALRYLVALLIARVGVGLLFRVVGAYAGDVWSDDAADEGGPEATDGAGLADDQTNPGRRHNDDMDLNVPEAEDMLDDALDEVHDTTAMVP